MTRPLKLMRYAAAVLLLSMRASPCPAQEQTPIVLNGYVPDSPPSATARDLKRMWEGKLSAALSDSGVRHPQSASAIADLLNAAFQEDSRARWNEAILLAVADSFRACSDDTCARPFAFLGATYLAYPKDAPGTTLIIKALGFIASWNRIKSDQGIKGAVLRRRDADNYFLGPGCRPGELCAAEFAAYTLASMHASLDRNSSNDALLHQQFLGMKALEKDEKLHALFGQSLDLIDRNHFAP